jgi:RNA polymerase sigma-70 factor, ECF subfamily
VPLAWKSAEDLLWSDVAFGEKVPYTPPVPETITDEDALTALDRIPTEFRAVVLLADVQEFSYKDVANILNIPIGTVMSRLSRARRMLRDELAAVAQSYGIKKASQGVKNV